MSQICSLLGERPGWGTTGLMILRLLQQEIAKAIPSCNP
jgi:hypothetical protein